MYIKNPKEIEKKSMDIIEEVMDGLDYDEREKKIVKRMIHTTGDLEYRNIVEFRNGFVDAAIDLIKKESLIYSDTKMVNAGINKKIVYDMHCELVYFIDNQDVLDMSIKNKTTRSSASIDKAATFGVDIYVIGNAPTAVFRMLELIEAGKIKPKLIIAVPVGFVGAAECKEALRNLDTDIPMVTTVGNKGGSNVAASIVNALLYMVSDR
ncbi:precorrin-8X methylmutase [Microaceticoccus formicicus]|uniref:precorrin-8X methylmutase n=1 Tax=Microaceticoccus formicicus TaxID=3118105 RepID=UPI003CD04C81|nr:precorrin-8X methylmutase [Peptoniphilaceae bacterium AMB_02]